MATHMMSNAGLMRIISGLLFPVGLIMVMITGSELVTGNCLITISVLEKRASFAGMFRNLAIVFVANFIGAFLLAAALTYVGHLNYSGGALAVTSMRVASSKAALGFTNSLIMGFICNNLVCAAVMMSLCAKDLAGKAIGAYIPIAVFVFIGFEHCVANMYFVPIGLLARSIPAYEALAQAAGINLSVLTWKTFLLESLLPVSLGNLFGGMVFAASMWLAHRTKSA